MTSLLKILWKKEKLLVTSNYSFSHSVFYPFEEISSIFIEFEIVICKLFQFKRVQNFSFGKGLIQKRIGFQMIACYHGHLAFANKCVTHILKIASEGIANIISKTENSGDLHFLITSSGFFNPLLHRYSF